METQHGFSVFRLQRPWKGSTIYNVHFLPSNLAGQQGPTKEVTDSSNTNHTFPSPPPPPPHPAASVGTSGRECTQWGLKGCMKLE